MKVVVTGAAGLVGSAVCRMSPAGVNLVGLIRNAPAPDGVKSQRVELAQRLAMFDALHRIRPDLVIHTAYDPAALQSSVVDAGAAVASACEALGVGLIAMSTDMVFGGDSPPYDESSPPSPITEYGRAKYAMERSVMDTDARNTIVRSSIVVGVDPLDGASRWCLDALRDGREVTLFHDGIRAPILVEDLAAMLWELALMEPRERSGIWHLAGTEAMSRVELGAQLCRIHRCDPAGIVSASSSTSPLPRTKDLTLISNRAQQLSVRPRSLSSVGEYGSAKW